MSAPVPQTAKPAPQPPADTFWQKWSPHHEMPLATLASVAIHIVVIGLFLFYIAKLLNLPDDKAPVPIRALNVSTDIDGTDGGPGSGGGKVEAAQSQPDPMDPMPFIPDPKLAAVQEVYKQWAPELAQDPSEVKTVAELPNL